MVKLATKKNPGRLIHSLLQVNNSILSCDRKNGCVHTINRQLIPLTLVKVPHEFMTKNKENHPLPSFDKMG